MEAKDKIIVALDVDTPEKALGLVKELKDYVGCFKIGLQFITAMLRSIIVPITGREVALIQMLFNELDGNIMWDGKFDDIPNTVAGASQEVVKIGVKMFNLHASAGEEAIAKAVANKGKALCLGVTVLTSIDKDECLSIFGDFVSYKVIQFANMLVDEKADGVICSPEELSVLSEENIKLLKVTPGIRPKWAQKGDQKRVMTPGDAIKAGADYLVIGRPIRKPPESIGSPVEAAKKIAQEIKQALQEKGD